ncbi:SH3 domain-containing protein [Campylobacter sp.]|uniref:SH3 domain-containing protein n=1 Tax=Campylobacter sp. TaxID=205 RepID=UPI0026DD4AD3|nr:SH3 domain-containing protein [Campylobacter sp.]MDO4674521.1 SH3 domain-containing protein [Campylobacter sp.]
MRYLSCFSCLLALFSLACSAQKAHAPMYDLEPMPKIVVEKFPYATLEFEQDPSQLSALKTQNPHHPQSYKKHFFSAWHGSFEGVRKNDAFWSFEGYKRGEYYFFNKQKIPDQWFDEGIQNANISALGTKSQKALVVQNAFLKNFPTQRALLKYPFRDSEGIPFDYALDSVLNAGSAVLISHFSKDRRYAFVLSEGGMGFVEAENLEIFSERRAQIYENLPLITPLRERMPVWDEDGKFFFETRIGALYPYYKDDAKYYYGKIGAKKYKIAKNQASPFPLAFNDANLKRQIGELLGLPYGWGGYDFERDCSLFLRDIFAPFGIYLPRNSLAQNNAFTHFDVRFLSNEQKQDFLKKFGKAYLTFIYMRGHIMLYAGTLRGENVAIHDIWGLRLGEFDRLLIAQSAITSLEIGRGEVSEENLLLSKIEEFSFVELNEKEKASIENYLQGLKTQP